MTEIIVVVHKDRAVKVYAKGEIKKVKVVGVADKTVKEVDIEEYLETHQTLIDDIKSGDYEEIW